MTTRSSPRGPDRFASLSMLDPPFPADRLPPHRTRCDVAVLGAGFGGSLAACCLRAGGRSVALIDSGRHPRFALGESLTPHAAAVLKVVAERFGLAWLPPLLDPVEGMRGGPGVRSGVCRGAAWVPVNAEDDAVRPPLWVHHAGPHGAHWHRGDVDAFAAARAVAADVPFYDATSLRSAEARRGGGYVLSGFRRDGAGPNAAGPVEIEADFLIDAGPPGGIGRGRDELGLAELLNLPDETASLTTTSRLTFAHVTGLDPPTFAESLTDDAPDEGRTPAEAAVNHVFSDGWYREVRFADGTASVSRSGLFDESAAPDDAADPYRLQDRGGGLAERQGRSVHSAPGTEPFSTARLQRRVGRVAGLDYALLPAAAATLDPLHDTDLAHTAAAVLRLCTLLEESWGRPPLGPGLSHYKAVLDRELTRIDGLSMPAYAALGDWETFQLALHLHGAAAAGTWTPGGEDDEFLLAGDAAFTAAASAFAAGVGRLGAKELANGLRAALPHDGGRFFPSATL